MLRYTIVAFVALVLAGCVSAEEQQAMDHDRCSSYGFRPGTDAFANCMMTQGAQRAELEQRQLEADRNRTVIDDRRNRRRQRSQDDYIDTTPQYDSEGNPNFDTQGNYQGCHGIGCEVDTPDDDGSSDDEDSD